MIWPTQLSDFGGCCWCFFVFWTIMFGVEWKHRYVVSRSRNSSERMNLWENESIELGQSDAVCTQSSSFWGVLMTSLRTDCRNFLSVSGSLCESLMYFVIYIYLFNIWVWILAWALHCSLSLRRWKGAKGLCTWVNNSSNTLWRFERL